MSAAAYGGRWRNWVCGIAYIVIMGWATHEVIFVDLSEFEGDIVLLRILSLLWNYVIFGASWWFGDVLRTRRQRTNELEERTVQLEHEHEENAHRAVLDERVRIARELHDVVAHHVSVMGVQAGAARRVLKKQPEKAHEALSTIETSSRQAVDEMHRLLGFLRQGSQDNELAPHPGLRQLKALVSEMKDSGLLVEIKTEGKEKPLSPIVDLSAYRIIQEALTNTLKHAGPANATVTINYTDSSIELKILDDGRGPAPAPTQLISGRGLIGMRERVSLLGGDLQTVEAPGGGFLVKAVLPLAGRIS